MAKEKLTPPRPGERKILDQIQALLGKKLDQVALIGWGTSGFVVDPTGAVTGLGMVGLDMADAKLPELVENLQGLANLRMLDLCGNPLIDLSALANLTKLTTLHLSAIPLTDLSSLQALANLTTLDLSINQLTDLSGLQGLVNLRMLDLDGNQLTDLSPLQTLANLTRLDLSANQLTDLSPLQALTNLTRLDLSANQLTDLSPLQALTNLTRLDLDGNQLTDLSGLQGLANLTELYLGGNQLTDLSPLQALTNLTTLHLSRNQLTDLSPLQALTNLTTLPLSRNQLTDLSPLQALANLTRLDLDGNQLTDLSPLQALTNLTTLHLHRNKIKELPEWIMEQGMEIYGDSKYHGKGIVLGGNPLETPPMHIIEQGREAIRSYFRQLRESEAKTKKDHYLFEAKLLIIGEAGAGKTTFARKLRNPQADMPKPEDTTRGIDVHKWSFEITGDDFPKLKGLNLEKTSFYLNLWDFGGQEIYHGTHQFFFSQDALYVLLGDTREQKTDFNYWLLTIEQLAGNSPLIIVLNRREKYDWRIDQTGLKGRFGEMIKEIKTVDLSQPQDIPELQRSVKYWFSSLPMIGDKLPGNWVDIREELSWAKRTFITYEAFQGLCRKHEMTDIQDIEVLSRYYDKIGVITHYIDDPVLQERVYIDSNWLVKTVYRLLDDAEVKNQRGRLTKKQVRQIWKDNEVYQEIEKLLHLMMRFGLLFKVEGKDEYIVPEHLQEGKPYEFWPHERGEVLRFHYEFGKYMPKGLMARLIVKLHHHVRDYDLAWLRGVNVEYNGAKAEVVETYGEKNIFAIRVSGENQKDLLVIIREHFEQIIGQFKNLKPDKLIPCNCESCRKIIKTDKKSMEVKMYPWEEVLNYSRNDIDQISCGKSCKPTDIHKLLGDYGMVKEEREQDKKSGGDTYNIYGDHTSLGDDAKHDGDIINPGRDYVGRDSKTTNPAPKEKEPGYKKWHAKLAIIVSVIAILGFATGIRSCRELRDKMSSLFPTVQPGNPPESKPQPDPNRVDANTPISKPPGG